METTTRVVIIAFTIGIIVNGILMYTMDPFGFRTWTEETVTYTYNDLYYTEAPFGILYADTEGQYSGGFLWSSGSMDTKLSESYIVKYWVGNQLRSKALDADATPIIVDGTFRLNTTTFTSKLYQKVRYTLHLPYLPENVTNYDWKGVG